MALLASDNPLIAFWRRLFQNRRGAFAVGLTVIQDAPMYFSTTAMMLRRLGFEIVVICDCERVERLDGGRPTSNLPHAEALCVCWAIPFHRIVHLPRPCLPDIAEQMELCRLCLEFSRVLSITRVIPPSPPINLIPFNWTEMLARLGRR